MGSKGLPKSWKRGMRASSLIILGALARGNWLDVSRRRELYGEWLLRLSVDDPDDWVAVHSEIIGVIVS